ncbi:MULTISPECIES: alpha/beta hydrolase [unclassified Nostoc]|uniref:alpha/beta hydrolase n=1 Tax=unclassified Nostoc TaxID=2593658 RepID=UPI002AD4EE39|nr:alpha/beta hydrolase [Nostoc sp. DedQUE03]MDZ7975075.1 alpha/beta hydrolase [Nostoc sp. DedQUE03]MDZ8043987.1 alpha/beta hydrolase [Nostoc sp. DedQUE02]
MNSPDKKNLADNQPYKIYEFKKNNQENISGYLVVSTAKLNVETEEQNSNSYLSSVANKNFFNLNDGQAEPSAQEMIQKIAQSLQSSSEPEIIINIHGYSSTPSDTEIGCKKIYEYVNTHIQQPNKYIFIGYRWPSENPVKTDESGSFGQKLINALSSLPILLAINLVLGLTISIWSAIALLFLNILSNSAVHFYTAILILSGIVSSILFTLIILRMSTYFRDTYRASNYGVTDLVELIRQLDHTVNLPPNKRIKLSFISHSMGCFVVTDVIRILSDVFDVKSINKKPNSDIGNVFRLGRLVLVAPDIPIESILPGRANFLRSSLRRCEEAYIFCNEGDLALRFTSTAANYFSFPARTRISGYRLGNITVKHFNNKNDSVGHTPRYGVVNLSKQDDGKGYRLDNPYKYLEIRSSSSEHRKLEEITEISEELVQPADLFTYFDCTDYKDDRFNKIGIVSSAIKKPAINFGNYIFLTLAFIRKSINNRDPQGVDTHTGYFEGNFSQKAIYELAFLGFQGFLRSLLIEGDESDKLSIFSERCHEKQIQVILAPQIYQQKTQD